MTFEQSYLDGYIKHSAHFDKLSRHTSVLGDIQQCAILELDSSGHAFIASNRPDIGEQSLTKQFYEYEDVWSFFTNPKIGITTFSTQFDHENSDIYIDACKLSGFIHREVIDENIQQCCAFFSDSPIIYDKLINNLELVNKYIQFFKQESQSVINYYRERKFNLAEHSNNYFRTEPHTEKTQREQTVKFLQEIGILDRDVNISPQEWKCLQLYRMGKTAGKTGEILGISRRTVEGHFAHIKQKLKADSKAEILGTIS